MALWQNLSEFDKQQSSSTDSPAQRPDHCRLMDAILLRLCKIHRGPGEEEMAWCLILQDYSKIRELILANANLQLVNVSQRSLMQWRNQTCAATEKQATLKTPPVDIAKCPAARPKLARKTQPVRNLVTFDPCPASTLTVVAIPQHLVPPTPAMLVFIPSTAHILPYSSTPGSQRPAAPRAYKRKVEANTCKKCGAFRTAATGHSQFRGTIYCPATETLSKEQWLENMRGK